ncbi:MAG: ABC transporter ATP-binding protein, partial [Flavobacteriales bacterium]
INKDHLSAHLRSVFYYSVFFPIVEILSALSIGLVIWYGGEAIISDKEVTLGELVAFILYIHMMFRPIRQLADRFNILQMGIVGSERVFKVLDTEDFISDNGKKELDTIEGNVEYRNVQFAYKDEDWVLNNLSFKIEKGKHLALVGRTGSGKTSIINILNRFYEIQEGEILIDGINITDFSLRNLRKHTAIVQQEVHLFSSTIMENIILFDEDIKEYDVINSAKEIGIHDFIMSLPGGYNYVVGERGITLSTGQRQLISFLRVYLRNPKILILDEATSSIDSHTEEILQTALNKLSEGRTTIVIAHRLSTIINSDKILLLENGKVLEEGTHSELLKKGGKYSEMYITQISD